MENRDVRFLGRFDWNDRYRLNILDRIEIESIMSNFEMNQPSFEKTCDQVEARIAIEISEFPGSKNSDFPISHT
jgi:hypothetical protein